MKNILSLQTKKISFSSIVLASSYFVSALLGLLRDRLLAGRFGAGNELDVYYAAFTIPDLIALLLIFGAISAAVIPIFSSYLVRSKEEAWQYLSVLLNVFLSILIIACLILMVFSPLLISLVAPGFSESKKQLAALLMRIMFLSPIILGTSNIISGVLQVFHRFLATALAPVMYNIGIIIGILIFVPLWGVAGLAWGVVFGGLLHLFIQLPALVHSGFKFRTIFNFQDRGVLKTLQLMVPRSLGLAAGQINIIVTTAIASTLAAGSIAVFNLANNVASLFNNVVAVALSTAIFPAMALAYIRKDHEDLSRKFSAVLDQIMFFSIPVSVMIFILRNQIIRLLLQTGRFNQVDASLTALCLGIFSVGLFFQGMIVFLSKIFYATGNTKTPAILSGSTVVFNIILSSYLVYFWHFNIAGLAIAYSTTAVLEGSLLLFFVSRQLHIFRQKFFWQSFFKIIICSVAMAIATRIIWQTIGHYEATFWALFAHIFVSMLAGIACYIAISFFLNSPELKIFKDIFSRNNGSY